MEPIIQETTENPKTLIVRELAFAREHPLAGVTQFLRQSDPAFAIGEVIDATNLGR